MEDVKTLPPPAVDLPDTEGAVLRETLKSLSNASEMNTAVVMRGEEEPMRLKRGGVNGRQTGLVQEKGTESEIGLLSGNVGERGDGTEIHLPPNKLNASNTMSGEGKTVRGARKIRNMNLDSLKKIAMEPLRLPQKKRNQILNCQELSPRTPIPSEGWLSNTMSHQKLVFLKEDGGCTPLRMMSLSQSCTFTDRVLI